MTRVDGARTPVSPGLRMAIDYGPLIVFFLINFAAPSAPLMRLVASFTPFLSGVDKLAAVVLARVICATAGFMIATLVAMVVSHSRTGHISPMLWISGGLVVVFGGLTIYFRDPRFIQMKPTIVYATFSIVLLLGLVTGRPLLQGLLEAAYPGLDAEGWRKLTRNWMLFFAGMAVLNELVWRSTSWDFWVGFKLWGAIPLTLLFAIANVPMLLRHGMQATEPAVSELPPEA